MLLATYHVLLQTWQVNGGQTKYTGHTCLFAHDTGQFINKLPLAPTSLDVLVIRPASASVVAMSRRPEFQVRRARILANLQALQRFHPDYTSTEIDEGVLASLPEDGSVFEQLRSTTVEDQPQFGLEAGPDTVEEADQEAIVTEAVIPNIGDPVRVVDDVRAALAPLVQQDLVLTAPVIQASLVNEHDPTNPFLRRAFPFLFPSGRGDLHNTRTHKIAEGDYFAHLIRYKDGRFAQDPRFRYVSAEYPDLAYAPRYYAFNCIMRWRAKRAAGFYVSRHDEDRGMVAADFADLLEGDARELAARVRRHAGLLLGTGPYWGKQSRNLQAMIRQLGTPHAFITHSAADIQWPDLHAHMAGQSNTNITEAERQRHNALNINKNPAITAWWFQRRWSLFFRLVIKPLFSVREHWFRYEWQHRGSSHVHGLIWLEGAPSPDTLDINNEPMVEEFLQYWTPRVCAINPKADEPPATLHPCAVLPDDMSFTHQRLAQMLNRVQHHT